MLFSQQANCRLASLFQKCLDGLAEGLEVDGIVGAIRDQDQLCTLYRRLLQPVQLLAIYRDAASSVTVDVVDTYIMFQ